MPHQPATLHVVFVHGMLSGVRMRGEPVGRYLEAAGIPRPVLDDPDARVTMGQYIALYRSLINLREDECLGFLSRALKPGSFALVSRSALGAADLEVAIRRFSRTFRLLQDDVTVVLQRKHGLAALALDFQAGSAMASSVFLHEMLLRIFWQLAAWFAGGQLPAVSFTFAFEAPAHAARYNAIFPGAHDFRQAHTAVWFDDAWLKAPVRRDEAALRMFLADAQTSVLLPQRGANVVGARVCRYLSRTQPDWPNLAVTAAALNMSVSTLQRRLALEGTSFQVLKDALRTDIAIAQLRGNRMTLPQLAQQLGFADVAAFQHAFKRWAGRPPGAYRRNET
jgi:AraC-like DNA-binding protein